MGDVIKRIDYYYVTVPDKAGEGARVLAALEKAGVNFTGISAFPEGARKAQIDLIPEDSAAFVKAAKSAGLQLSRKKTGFQIQGTDRPGTLADVAQKLANAGINVVSAQVFCAGGGRYGGMLWVKPEDVRKASRVLGAA